MAQNSIDNWTVNVYAKAKPINFNKNDYCKTLAARNNNPGNLRGINNPHFRRFATLKEGYDALLHDIYIKQSGQSSHLKPNASLYEFIHVYAPAFENNTNQYIKIVCNKLHITSTTKIKDIDKRDLARAIIMVEDYELYKIMYN